MSSHIDLRLDHLALLALWYKDNFSLRHSEDKVEECMGFVCDLIREYEKKFIDDGECLFGEVIADNDFSVEGLLFLSASRVKTIDEMNLQSKLLPHEIKGLAILVDDWFNHLGDYKRLDCRDDENPSGKLSLIQDLSLALSFTDEWEKQWVNWHKEFPVKETLDWDNRSRYSINFIDPIVSRRSFSQYDAVKTDVQVEKFADIFKRYDSCRDIDHGELVEIVNKRVNGLVNDMPADYIGGR